MGLFQAVTDFYDYKYPYYRYYVLRRIMFKEDKAKANFNKPTQSLFANNDYENLDLILKKTVTYFSIAGIKISPII